MDSQVEWHIPLKVRYSDHSLPHTPTALGKLEQGLQHPYGGIAGGQVDGVVAVVARFVGASCKPFAVELEGNRRLVSKPITV